MNNASIGSDKFKNALVIIGAMALLVLSFVFVAWLDWELVVFLVGIFPIEGGISGFQGRALFFMSLVMTWVPLAFFVKTLCGGGKR